MRDQDRGLGCRLCAAEHTRAPYPACSCGIQLDISAVSPTLRNTNDAALEDDSADSPFWHHTSRYENSPDSEADTADVIEQVAQVRGGAHGGRAMHLRGENLQFVLPWTPERRLVILLTMSEVSSLAETKAHLSELVARVGDQHERITVTVHGRPVAVLLAVDDLESLEETIAVLSDAAALHALGEADAELARGEGENQDSLAAAMQARRART